MRYETSVVWSCTQVTNLLNWITLIKSSLISTIEIFLSPDWSRGTERVVEATLTMIRELSVQNMNILLRTAFTLAWINACKASQSKSLLDLQRQRQHLFNFKFFKYKFFHISLAVFGWKVFSFFLNLNSSVQIVFYLMSKMLFIAYTLN